MRIIFYVGAAAVLAACSMSSTPTGGDCAMRASIELNALQAAIATAETNLARGYATVRRTDENGQASEVQVPINAAQEQAKLAELKGRLGEVQARTEAAIARCG